MKLLNDILQKSEEGCMIESLVSANDPDWMKNPPAAKFKKLVPLKIPVEIKSALASKLSHGELNELIKVIDK